MRPRSPRSRGRPGLSPPQPSTSSTPADHLAGERDALGVRGEPELDVRARRLMRRCSHDVSVAFHRPRSASPARATPPCRQRRPTPRFPAATAGNAGHDGLPGTRAPRLGDFGRLGEGLEGAPDEARDVHLEEPTRVGDLRTGRAPPKRRCRITCSRAGRPARPARARRAPPPALKPASSAPTAMPSLLVALPLARRPERQGAPAPLPRRPRASRTSSWESSASSAIPRTHGAATLAAAGGRRPAVSRAASLMPRGTRTAQEGSRKCRRISPRIVGRRRSPRA